MVVAFGGFSDRSEWWRGNTDFIFVLYQSDINIEDNFLLLYVLSTRLARHLMMPNIINISCSLFTREQNF